MSNEIAIQAHNLSKVYKLYNKPEDRLKEAFSLFGSKEYHKEHYALYNISLTITKGQTIGIIGKNGSGKSTLLKILAGVLSPSNGNVEVNGKVTSLLELGAGFNPEYTGIENIYLNGTIMSYSREEMTKKLPEILDFADIGEYVYQPVKTYSSGMFARLAFSVMVHLDPDILIVDEALSVGDIFFQQKCNQFMKHNMNNTTKLLVTHDMNSIANLADYCIVLDKGKKVYEGDPLNSIEYYIKSLHTESFSTADSEKGVSDETIKSQSLNEQKIGWTLLDPEKLGGALEATFIRYHVKVNELDYKGFVQAGDEVAVSFTVFSKKNFNDGILGYIISDKFGNQIFGENTITSEIAPIKIKQDGENTYQLSFIWPEIKEGEYFLTLGLGEGEHELQHKIQCWAHNIFKFDCITPRKTIHCLFNNPIKAVQLL